MLLRATPNDRRTFTFLGLLSILCLACGVAAAGRDATLNSALEFRDMFVDELQLVGHVTVINEVESVSANHTRRVTTYHLPPQATTPAQVADLAESARIQWGRTAEYAIRSHGARGSRYKFRYGNDDSHVFFDIQARLGEGGVVEVECVMRVIE